MSQVLTTAQAAKRAKTSRPTISRALKTGDLQGNRGNDGRWLILADDLDAWAALRSAVHDEQRANIVHERKKPTEIEQLNAVSRDLEDAKTELAYVRERLARAEGENAANKERITDLTTQRDRLMTALEARPAVVAGGFWSRLLGRS